MRMPDEFSLEPLAADSLISQLHPDLIDVALDMLHSPFAEPNSLPPILHGTNMLVHGLQDRGVSDRRMTLHQGQRLSFSLVSRRSRRRQHGPCIVKSAQQQDRD